jgi:hypothetical protein
LGVDLGLALEDLYLPFDQDVELAILSTFRKQHLASVEAPFRQSLAEAEYGAHFGTSRVRYGLMELRADT